MSHADRTSPTGQDHFLTTAEVADLARTSPSTVRYWRHLRKGPRGHKVGRRVLYRESDVEAWLHGCAEDDR